MDAERWMQSDGKGRTGREMNCEADARTATRAGLAAEGRAGGGANWTTQRQTDREAIPGTACRSVPGPVAHDPRRARWPAPGRAGRRAADDAAAPKTRSVSRLRPGTGGRSHAGNRTTDGRTNATTEPTRSPTTGATTYGASGHSDERDGLTGVRVWVETNMDRGSRSPIESLDNRLADLSLYRSNE
jgi:hypothetical protein